MNRIENNPKFKFSMIDNLMFSLSSSMILLYIEEPNWANVRKKSVELNLAQKATLSSNDRYVSEALSRLRYLTDGEISYFKGANDQEQRYLLWIALCRSNRLAREFAIKLLRENFLNYKNKVSLEDYDSFYFDLSSSNEELDHVSLKMKSKIRGRIINTAKEANILSKDNFIQPCFLTEQFCKTVTQNSPQDLLYLPIYEADIKGL